MDRLEQLFIGVAAILLVVSIAHFVMIPIIRRRATCDGLVDEVEIEGVEFPQVLRPGSPDSYIPRGFEALGLPANATPDEVRAAFRCLALQVHPYHGGNTEGFMRLQADSEHALSHVERHFVSAVGQPAQRAPAKRDAMVTPAPRSASRAILCDVFVNDGVCKPCLQFCFTPAPPLARAWR